MPPATPVLRSVCRAYSETFQGLLPAYAIASVIGQAFMPGLRLPFTMLAEHTIETFQGLLQAYTIASAAFGYACPALCSLSIPTKYFKACSGFILLLTQAGKYFSYASPSS